MTKNLIRKGQTLRHILSSGRVSSLSQDQLRGMLREAFPDHNPSDNLLRTLEEEIFAQVLPRRTLPWSKLKRYLLPASKAAKKLRKFTKSSHTSISWHELHDPSLCSCLNGMICVSCREACQIDNMVLTHRYEAADDALRFELYSLLYPDDNRTVHSLPETLDFSINLFPQYLRHTKIHIYLGTRTEAKPFGAVTYQRSGALPGHLAIRNSNNVYLHKTLKELRGYVSYQDLTVGQIEHIIDVYLREVIRDPRERLFVHSQKRRPHIQFLRTIYSALEADGVHVAISQNSGAVKFFSLLHKEHRIIRARTQALQDTQSLSSARRAHLEVGEMYEYLRHIKFK